MGVWVGGHRRTNFSHISKYAQLNSISFDINVVTEGDRRKTVSNEKLTKMKRTGLKFRKLTLTQMGTPYFIY